MSLTKSIGCVVLLILFSMRCVAHHYPTILPVYIPINLDDHHQQKAYHCLKSFYCVQPTWKPIYYARYEFTCPYRPIEDTLDQCCGANRQYCGLIPAH